MSAELRRLQEALDANKDNMPEGAYLELMQHLRGLYTSRALPSAHWLATVVSVSPVSSRRLAYETRTYILQEVERGAAPTAEGWLEVLRTAQISRECAQDSHLPIVLRDGRGGLNLVVSCEEEDESDAESV